MTLNTVKAPTTEQLREVAAELGMTFTDEDLAHRLASFAVGLAHYDIVDKMTDELPAVKYPRLPTCR